MCQRNSIVVTALLIIGCSLVPQYLSVLDSSGAARSASIRQRVHSELQNAEYKRDQVIVRYRTGASDSDVSQVRAQSKTTKVKDLHIRNKAVRMQLVKIDLRQESLEDALVSLSTDPNVEYAEPNYILRPDLIPDDTNFSLQWGLQNTGQTILGEPGISGADIKATDAWGVTTGSTNTVIALIDTGVQVAHPDLSNQLWNNPGEIADNGIDDDGNGYVDDVHGWDFKNNNNSLFDGSGLDAHGTHVAGIIGAQSNNNQGVAGVNHSVQIMVLKALDGVTGGTVADIVEAINYAKSFNVKISNNSYGGTGASSALKDAIQDSGMLYVAAAGNSGTNNDSRPFYPASYDLYNIISVGATDNNDDPASFSNYGLRSVDLFAPGQDILSTYPLGMYAYLSGTSMATPFVTGTAGLLLSLDSSLSTLQVRDLILTTVDTLPALSGLAKTGGRLNAYAAVSTVGTPGFDESEARSTHVYHATTDLSHRIGLSVADADASNGSAWSATVAANRPGYIVLGPKVSDLSPGKYTALFRMKLASRPKNPVVRIEVRPGRFTVVQRAIKGTSFSTANKYQDIVLNFTQKSAPTTEFRVYFYDKADVSLDTITVISR